jgi:hypothetical protein
MRAYFEGKGRSGMTTEIAEELPSTTNSCPMLLKPILLKTGLTQKEYDSLHYRMRKKIPTSLSVL